MSSHGGFLCKFLKQKNYKTRYHTIAFYKFLSKNGQDGRQNPGKLYHREWFCIVNSSLNYEIEVKSHVPNKVNISHWLVYLPDHWVRYGIRPFIYLRTINAQAISLICNSPWWLSGQKEGILEEIPILIIWVSAIFSHPNVIDSDTMISGVGSL